MSTQDAFVVRIKPGLVRQRTESGELEIVGTNWDIYVHDAHNDNLLVFSKQGYENRGDAIGIADKLFAGKPATLEIYDGDAFLENTVDLRTSQ